MFRDAVFFILGIFVTLTSGTVFADAKIQSPVVFEDKSAAEAPKMETKPVKAEIKQLLHPTPTASPSATPTPTVNPAWNKPAVKPTAFPTRIPTPTPTQAASKSASLTPTPVVEANVKQTWTGQASFYSRAGCVGCSTNLTMANGQTLNDSALTVAFNWAPLGSRLRITNLTNNQHVIATVTDTGGFTKIGRIIDLTVATRDAISCSSLCNVKVELLA